MKARIEISMDNAAFADAGHRTELARILRKLANQTEDAGPDEFEDRLILDINGNRVGKFEVLK